MAYHKYLDLDGMGIFFWFQLGWWDTETRQQRIEEATETLEWFTKKGYEYINYFVYMYNEHWTNEHYEHLYPWRRSKKPGEPFFLHRIRPKWLRSFEAWNELLLQTGHRSRRCDHMARYCWLPWATGRNVNGVRGFFHPAALEHQVHFANELNRIEREIYGDEGLSARVINEPNHNEWLPGFDYTGYNGRSDGGLHAIHDWLRDYYEEGLKGDVDLQRILVDTSTSEANPFVGAHPCPKCTTRTLGDDKYLTPNKKRQVMLVNHGYSVPQNVGAPYNLWLGSAWGPPHVHWFGGDGGSGAFKKIAKGHKLYFPDGTLIWAQGDPGQTRRLCKKIFEPAVAAGKYAGYSITCFETLQGWPWIENFKLSEIHRGRINAAVNAHKAAYGD